MQIDLSEQEMRSAQQTCVRQSFWNGLGAGFLYGDIIALIALFYSANEFQVTLLFAVIHASYPVALLAPKFLHGRDCTSVWRLMWLLRTSVVPCYFLLPLIAVQYQAWLIVGIFFIFCALRAVGVSASLPVMQSVSTSGDRQAFFGKHVQAFTFSCIIVTVSTYIVLEGGIFDSILLRYQALIALGFFFSAIATLYLYRLPATGTLEYISAKEISKITVHVLRDGEYRRLILLASANTFILVLCGSIIPYMKNIIQVSSGGIVLICSCGLCGAGAAMYFLRGAGGRVCSFLMLSFQYVAIGGGMFFLAVSHLIAPVGQIIYFIPAIVMLYAGKTSSVAIIGKLQADSLPAGKRYAYSSVFQISSAVSAVIAICFIAFCRNNWSGDVAADNGFYAHVFFTCALCCIGLCIFTLNISRKTVFQNKTAHPEKSAIDPSA